MPGSCGCDLGRGHTVRAVRIVGCIDDKAILAYVVENGTEDYIRDLDRRSIIHVLIVCTHGTYTTRVTVEAHHHLKICH